MNKLLSCVLVICFMLVGCGQHERFVGGKDTTPTNNQPINEDNVVVRGKASVNFNTIILNDLRTLLPIARSALGTTTVTYTNAASVSFTIGTSGLIDGGFTGTTLSMGSVSLGSIDDNHLKVCGVGGNEKCTLAIIRVYTTGSTAGFVHQVDGYGAPVYAGTLNPSSAIGLNAAGSVQVQTLTIAANKNRVRLSDFSSPTYAVTSDFSNAGSGSYSMAFVVEYALAKP